MGMTDPKPLAPSSPKTTGKSVDRTNVPVGALVPSPVGGMLKHGNPGNRGGPGVPPSELRKRLRGSFAERVEVLEQIADGEPTVRTKLELSAILPYVFCPKCNSKLEAEDKSIEINVLQSASNRDRIGALELAAKYGLGTLKEVSTESVRERVKDTLEVIRQHCPADVAARVITALRPVWTEK